MSANLLEANILYVEDNQADAYFVKQGFKNSKIKIDLNVLEDGDKALEYLKGLSEYPDASLPDLILLDLNLPRVDGHTVLKHIKSNPALKKIPVLILTSSQAPTDIQKSYENHANGYIMKPMGLEQMRETTSLIERFWFNLVILP